MKEPNKIQKWFASWLQPAMTNEAVENPNARSGTYGNAYVVPYDGEKNLGEIGPAFDYVLDFDMLRIRSWQSYLENDISQTILNKYVLWMIDEGLKLQANPAKLVLEEKGIKMENEKFNNSVEAHFSIWANSTYSSFDGMEDLNTTAKEAYKNAKIGGDVLVVLRLVDGIVKVQLIDGCHVRTPFIVPPEDGNRIMHGVEVDAKGTHVAYHIQKKDMKYERIPAVGGKSKLVMAFMVYGSKYRLDNYRGMPIIGTSLESLAKIDRYKEAAVGGAEERAKIPYSIEHESYSTGESPLANSLASAFDAGQSTSTDLPVDEAGNQLANTVSSSTNKTVFNMPLGAKIKAIQSTQEMFFKDFYGTMADTICSAIGIPPNVAFSIYNDSFMHQGPQQRIGNIQ